MSRQQQSCEVRQDARDLWRQARRMGDPEATFRPGQTVRCTGTLRTTGYYGPCGSVFSGEVVNEHSRVIIRVRQPLRRNNDPQPGSYLRCRVCGTALEKLTILEAPE
jgi:hypothetical protein